MVIDSEYINYNQAQTRRGVSKKLAKIILINKIPFMRPASSYFFFWFIHDKTRGFQVVIFLHYLNPAKAGFLFYYFFYYVRHNRKFTDWAMRSDNGNPLRTFSERIKTNGGPECNIIFQWWMSINFYENKMSSRQYLQSHKSMSIMRTFTTH